MPDWMKVEKKTPRKPEIFRMAEILGVSRGDVFLACFDVWSWADDESQDGYVHSVTSSAIDSIAGIAGFADALSEVGWLNLRTGAVEIPNFVRHMGQSAKSRALTSIRMTRSRLRKCDAPSVTEPSPDKRREEKSKKNPPTPLPGGVAVASFDSFWSAYPRKTDKAAARKAWVKLKPDADLLAVMLAALERQKRSHQWAKNGGEFIPHASTWLNKRRWEDEPEPPPGGIPPPLSEEQAAARLVARREAEAAERARIDAEGRPTLGDRVRDAHARRRDERAPQGERLQLPPAQDAGPEPGGDDEPPF
jgi:hypothetical protein